MEPTPDHSSDETTLDRLLDGRVLLEQPRSGYRAAIDPVLLAAAVPARAGERVLEAGIGTGAAALCLVARTGAAVLGVERDPGHARLAAANAARNGAAFEVLPGAIEDQSILARLAADGPFAHAMANPPFWDEARSTPSPDPGRRGANHAAFAAMLAAWCETLARLLAPRGSLTLILPAEAWAIAAQILTKAGLGALVLLPVLPRRSRPASRILLGGRKGARSASRILPPLVLHGEHGPAYGEAARAILWDGAAIELHSAVHAVPRSRTRPTQRTSAPNPVERP